jgi:hypothetical protein
MAVDRSKTPGEPETVEVKTDTITNPVGDIPLPQPSEGFSAESAHVFLEPADHVAANSDPGVDVRVKGHDAPNLSRFPRVKSFFVRTKEGAERLSLEAKEVLRGKWKVTVTFFRKAGDGAQRAALWMKCPTCKLFMKTVVAAVATAAGVPPPDFPGAEWVKGHAGEHIANVIGFLVEQSPVDAAKKALGAIPPELIEVVRKAFEAVKWVVDVPDKIYEFCCKQLGFC